MEEGDSGNPKSPKKAQSTRELSNSDSTAESSSCQDIAVTADASSDNATTIAQAAQDLLEASSTNRDTLELRTPGLIRSSGAGPTDDSNRGGFQRNDASLHFQDTFKHESTEQASAFKVFDDDDYPSYSFKPRRSFQSQRSHDPFAIPKGLEYAASTSIPFEEMDLSGSKLDPASSLDESRPRQIQAFAKLEFDNGPFYMNTYAIVLGRDIRAARLAAQKEQELDQKAEAKAGKRNTGPVDGSRDAHAKSGSSLKSDAINGDSTHDTSTKKKKKKKKRRSKKSKSTSSSSQFWPHKDTTIHPSMTWCDRNRSETPEAPPRPVNPSTLLPSPEDCPLVPIHSPAALPGKTSTHKGISRQHAKIAYNFDKHLFELHILGGNGAFVDEVWFGKKDVVVLNNGSRIQIKNTSFTFILPDVPSGATGAEGNEGSSEPSYSGKMSFEFENAQGEVIQFDHSSNEFDDSDAPDKHDQESSESTAGDGDEVDPYGRGRAKTSPSKPEPSNGIQEQVVHPEPEPQKRRGPGRPPKNGIMSKREQAERARAAKQAAKRLAASQAPPPVQSTESKPKAGKSGNNTKTRTPSPSPISTEPPKKRPYKKRRPKTAIEDQPQPSIEPKSASEDLADQEPKEVKPPKEKKPMRPPKSPSPDFDLSKLTAEDLAKPQGSYVVLIWDALTASNKPMSLAQIYHAIVRKYPYFKYKVQTKGWESSVRHNLSQHSAFDKVARDGKGWLWGIKPGASIEKEKRQRRISPPAPLSQPYLQQQPLIGHSTHYPSMPLPAVSSLPGYMSAPQHSMPPPMPNSIPIANGLLPPMAAPVNGYTSPYAPPPLPPATAPTAAPITPSAAPTAVPTTPSAQFFRPSYSSTSAPTHLPQPPLSSSHNGANGFYANTTRFQPPTYPPQSISTVPHNNTNQTHLPPLTHPTPPPAFPAPPRTPNSKASADVLQAFAKFKVAFVGQMPDKARGEAIVSSAINRTLGLATKSNVPGAEDATEAVVIKTLQGMLGGLGKKSEGVPKPILAPNGGGKASAQMQSQGRQTPAPTPSPSPQQTQIQQQLQQFILQNQQQQQQQQQQQSQPNGGTGRTIAPNQAEKLLQMLAKAGRENQKKDNALKGGPPQSQAQTQVPQQGVASGSSTTPRPSTPVRSESAKQGSTTTLSSPPTVVGDEEDRIDGEGKVLSGAGVKRRREDSVGENEGERAKRVGSVGVAVER